MCTMTTASLSGLKVVFLDEFLVSDLLNIIYCSHTFVKRMQAKMVALVAMCSCS
jgi:hypothetical protein